LLLFRCEFVIPVTVDYFHLRPGTIETVVFFGFTFGSVGSVNVMLDVGFVDIFCHNLECVWFSLIWPHDTAIALFGKMRSPLKIGFTCSGAVENDYNPTRQGLSPRWADFKGLASVKAESAPVVKFDAKRFPGFCSREELPRRQSFKYHLSFTYYIFSLVRIEPFGEWIFRHLFPLPLFSGFRFTISR
jgi:hypothetical protein